MILFYKFSRLLFSPYFRHTVGQPDP